MAHKTRKRLVKHKAIAAKETHCKYCADPLSADQIKKDRKLCDDCLWG
jgi:hypothetical protein